MERFGIIKNKTNWRLVQSTLFKIVIYQHLLLVQNLLLMQQLANVHDKQTS